MDLHAAAHVFVADLDGLDLTDDDQHHLGRVLRLRPGQVVTAGDGAGGWRVCEWTAAGLAPVGAIEHDERPDPPITIGFVVPKADRPEWIVQKLTETGVDRIVPLSAARSVVQWDGDKAAKQLARLRRVAREAAMQCRRARLPTVEPLTGFGDVAGRPGAAIATLGGQMLDVACHRLLIVGPEGGWSPEELESPPPRVGLGNYVLRSETAAIAAGALMTALRGRFI